jgi:hypothetical protein
MMVTMNPHSGRLLLKVFGGTALILAILLAIGEIGILGN